MVSVSHLINLIPEKTLGHILFLQSEIEKIGHELYLIGGCVRDLVMEKVPHDYDFATSLPPERLKKLFKRVIDTGIKHGTVTILIENESYELTTYRIEQGYSDGRRPDKVEFGMSLKEDVLRRDFTMNAIALDVKGKKIYDYTDGINDIHQKIIRTIGKPEERFSEDGLRPIRCIRFMCTLDFTIESNTYNALKKTQTITKKISVERFKDEIQKILSAGSVSKGIKELHKLEYFQLFFSDSLLNYSWNQELNLEKISRYNPVARLSGMLLYLFGYEVNSEKKMIKFLKELKFSNEQIKLSTYYIELLYKYRDQFKDWHHLEFRKKVTIRKILSDFIILFSSERSISPNLMGIAEIISYTESTITKSEILDLMNLIFSENHPLTLKDLKIDGKDLKSTFPMLEQRSYGGILKRCLELILEQPEKNNKEKLVEFIGSQFPPTLEGIGC